MELNECYYSAYSADDILTFFELIKNERDSMFHMRKEASEKYVKHFDGNNESFLSNSEINVLCGLKIKPISGFSLIYRKITDAYKSKVNSLLTCSP